MERSVLRPPAPHTARRSPADAVRPDGLRGVVRAISDLQPDQGDAGSRATRRTREAPRAGRTPPAGAYRRSRASEVAGWRGARYRPPIAPALRALPGLSWPPRRY